MRIGIDGRLWEETGVGRYLQYLVQNLAKIDTRNEYVIFLRKPEYEQENIQGKNITKVLADIQWHSIHEQVSFPFLLGQYHLDLMHFPYFSIPIFYTGVYVVTIHDLILHHFPTGRATKLPFPLYFIKLHAYRYIIQTAAYRARKVITVSHTTKQEVQDHLHIPEDKIVVTYEGVERRKGLLEKPPYPFAYFLHVGNVYPHKNVEVLVDAMRGGFLTSNVRLVFVGKNDYFMNQLQSYVQKQGLEEKVLFAGYLSDDMLASYYTYASAVVVPSLMEGFSLPVVEAMTYGAMVAVSDIPVHREICGSVGKFFDPKRKDQLIRVLQSIITASEKQKREYLQKAKACVDRFSWQKMAEETLNVYESSTRL